VTLRADTVVLSPGGDPSAPPAVDPYDLAGDEGIVMVDGSLTLVGLGRARTLTLDGGLADDSAVADIGHWLGGLPCTDPLRRPGTGAVAFGALPFDRHEPAGLVVPEVVYGRADDGTEWLTVVTGGDDDGDSRRSLPDGPPELPADPADLRAWLAAGAGRHAVGASSPNGAGTGGLPQLARIRPYSTDGAFLAVTAEAVAAIHRGEVDKVVLARQVDVETTGPLDVPALLRRWHLREPACTIFAMPATDGRRFVGASPELLVARRGVHVRSRPLAGTSGGDGDGPDGSRLLDSSKDTLEHRYVTEFIAGVLAPLCRELDVPEHPELAHLHSVTHLATPIAGVLDGDPGRSPGGDDGVPSALALVAALHPTPAVGGVPREAALAMIASREHPRRDHYAGPVGWTDARGDGTWVVGIRAVTVHGTTARLAAGVGIVGASDPGAELLETNWKLTAVFEALVPGADFSAVGLDDRPPAPATGRS